MNYINNNQPSRSRTGLPRRSWLIFLALALSLAHPARLRAIDIIVTVENLAPVNGSFLTPAWVGVHDGAFDLFNPDGKATPGLESVAEDGASAALASEFTASLSGSSQAVTAGGPIAPGQRRSVRFSLDGSAPSNRFLSFISMVIPSNDAFIGNGEPRAFPIFDPSGNFTGGSWIITGSQVYDAGTEINDELPANTAFFGQTAANTGLSENGLIKAHPGFKGKGAGGILDAVMFASADFRAANYRVARVTIALAAEVIVTVENLAPPGGSYQTPVWLGVHNGAYDLFSLSSAASPGLESVAEDGATTALMDEFASSGAGSVQAVTAGGPIAPGQKRSQTLFLDRSSPNDRYLSYASMVIPSNDAFIGNADSFAHAIFDSSGRFVGGSWVIAGSQVYDAGTEMNDELPANTAFFGQTAANTGLSENGVIKVHPGLKAKGAGGILDSPMFNAADFRAANYQTARITVSEPLPPQSADVIVTVENLAPMNGTYLTPVWLAFHDGSFDLFDAGAAASPGLESVAEDGATTALTSQFGSRGANSVQNVTSGGPIAPGQSRSLRFSLDPAAPGDRYLSFASMVIPSNDAFIGNADPLAHPVFDGLGRFIGGRWVVAGSQVYDAGTEINNELPAHTAFFGQTAANTGLSENSVVQAHPGFKAKGAGGILDAAMFAGADFAAANFQVARITVSRAVNVVAIVENLAPPHGAYLTPMWMGIHNGNFDLFNEGSPASPGLESVAEDGASAKLTEEFLASGSGTIQRVTSGGPIAPGERRVLTFSLDPASPIDRYFTYASMVIPSNDAFIGNGNPVSRPVFDAAGQFVGGSWIVAGDQVKDAGSEQNDELPANTAFFGQTAANTGAAQNGVVAAHAGFKAKGSGGILDAPMFAGADFKAANYQLARITLARSIYISEITRSAGNIRLAWAGGNGPYTVQERSNLADNAWRDVLHTAEQSASISINGAAGFFRIVSLSP